MLDREDTPNWKPVIEFSNAGGWNDQYDWYCYCNGSLLTCLWHLGQEEGKAPWFSWKRINTISNKLLEDGVSMSMLVQPRIDEGKKLGFWGKPTEKPYYVVTQLGWVACRRGKALHDLNAKDSTAWKRMRDDLYERCHTPIKPT